MHSVRNARASPHPYSIKESETVVSRDDHIYAEDFDELMEIFRATQHILDEMGFQEIHEEFSENWETLPFKNGIEAWMWKDPFTAIVLDYKMRVKEPRSDRKTREDIYKVKNTIKAKVIKTRYPHWDWFQETTFLKRSALYTILWKLTHNILFRKEFEKYKEEAEEYGIELSGRLREIEGSLPAIGRSKREWYNPEKPR